MSDVQKSLTQAINNVRAGWGIAPRQIQLDTLCPPGIVAHAKGIKDVLRLHPATMIELLGELHEFDPDPMSLLYAMSRSEEPMLRYQGIPVVAVNVGAYLAGAE